MNLKFNVKGPLLWYYMKIATGKLHRKFKMATDKNPRCPPKFIFFDFFLREKVLFKFCQHCNRLSSKMSTLVSRQPPPLNSVS